jgi:hypothetical protein
MKFHRSFAFMLCAFMLGCAGLLPPSKLEEKPKSAGYGVVAQTYHSDSMHSYTMIELCRWDEKGRRSSLWPALNDFVPLSNRVVAFEGHLVDGPSDKYPGRLGPIRLFGAEDAGPVVDLSDPLISLWSKSSGTNFASAKQNGSFGTMKRRSDGLSIEIFLWPHGGGTVELTTDEFLKLIRDGKAKGTPMRDAGTKAPLP